MGVTRISIDGTILIRLDGEIGIDASAELREFLITACDETRNLRISLKEVSELDVTAMQLLWAAEREAPVRGIRLEFDSETPSAVQNAFSDAGLPIPNQSLHASENV